MRVVQKVLSLTEKRNAIAEPFCCGHQATSSYKNRKTNSDFCLNFCSLNISKRSPTNLKSW